MRRSSPAAIASTSARVSGQGIAPSGSPGSRPRAITRSVPPGATSVRSARAAVARAPGGSTWSVYVSTTRSKAARHAGGGSSRSAATHAAGEAGKRARPRDGRRRDVEGDDVEAAPGELRGVVPEARADVEGVPAARRRVGVEPLDEMRVRNEVRPRDDGGARLRLAVERLEPAERVAACDRVLRQRPCPGAVHGRPSITRPFAKNGRRRMKASMRIPSRIAALAALAWLASPARAADVHVGINIGVPPPPVIALPSPPPLVVVPTTPAVRYAPGVDVNLFFYGGRYYTFHRGAWFVAPLFSGPWVHVPRPRVPHALLVVPARYYRVPPGHWRKTFARADRHHRGRGHGWRGHFHGHGGHGHHHGHGRHR